MIWRNELYLAWPWCKLINLPHSCTGGTMEQKGILAKYIYISSSSCSVLVPSWYSPKSLNHGFSTQQNYSSQAGVPNIQLDLDNRNSIYWHIKVLSRSKQQKHAKNSFLLQKIARDLDILLPRHNVVISSEEVKWFSYSIVSLNGFFRLWRVRDTKDHMIQQ